MAILLPDKVYIIEFKVGRPGKAHEQLKKKGYHEKYRHHDREICLIGIGFDAAEKNITDFESEWI